ncbi:MAG: hypothetical protein SPI74_01235 [Eubacterium sp.]|nr:hypothetical protein [Eubacterium sp.]
MLKKSDWQSPFFTSYLAIITPVSTATFVECLMDVPEEKLFEFPSFLIRITIIWFTPVVIYGIYKRRTN